MVAMNAWGCSNPRESRASQFRLSVRRNDSTPFPGIGAQLPVKPVKSVINSKRIRETNASLELIRHY